MASTDIVNEQEMTKLFNEWANNIQLSFIKISTAG